MLEFFDYFLIGFVLAFIVGPWQLTFGQSAIILLSSGYWCHPWRSGMGPAGRPHRPPRRLHRHGAQFLARTGILAMTPDHGWIFLTIFRFFVGFGVGGLYCVDLPLVQEFMPASERGFIGGLVTAFIPLGVLLGSVLGAFLAPLIGWRGLFACGLVPALLCLLIRAWVPNHHDGSSDGTARRGSSLVGLGAASAAGNVPLPVIDEATTRPAKWTELFHYPRSLLVSWLSNLVCKRPVTA